MTQTDILNVLAEQLGPRTANNHQPSAPASSHTSAPAPPEYRSASAHDLAHIRKRLFQCGCSLVVVDELQFLTHSVNANALLADRLFFIGRLGLPVVYIGNYSLIRRLRKRPPEDASRLLHAPSFLLSDLPEDRSFREYLSEMKVVLGDLWDVDNNDTNREVLCDRAFGLKRTLRRLAIRGLWVASERRGKRGSLAPVRLEDIETAWKSAAFQQEREAVQAYQNASLELEAPEDFICPIALPDRFKAREAEIAERAKAQEAADAVLRGAMSAAERATTDAAAKERGVPAPGKPERSAGRSLKKPKLTADGLLKNI